MGANHISGTAAATVVRFCTRVGYIKSQRTDDKMEKSPVKGHAQSHVTHFKFWAPNDISATAKAKVITFCTQVDSIES